MSLLRFSVKASAVMIASAVLFCFARTGALAVPHLTFESAAPIYMNCPNFTKDATSAAGSGWIELNSFQWGVGRGITTSTGGSANRESSAPSVSEIVVTKSQDKASPKLMFASHSGEHSTCTVDFSKANGTQKQPYLQYTLENTMVTSVKFGGTGSGSERPTESITLNFTKIEAKYKVQGESTDTLPPGFAKAKPTPTPTPVAPK